MTSAGERGCSCAPPYFAGEGFLHKKGAAHSAAFFM